MHKQPILRLTLFVSILVMNPAVAQVNLRTDTRSATAQQTEEKQSVTEEIAATLETRGLEADAAQKLCQKVVGADEVHFGMMIAHLERDTSLTREEILVYLGNEALFRKEPDLTSYASLLHMATEITKSTPDQKMKSALQNVAKLNKLLSLS
jgi:hypothetical protein